MQGCSCESKFRAARPRASLGVPRAAMALPMHSSRLALPLQPPTSSSRLVFFHDRKTSGSTLREVLVQAARRLRLQYFVPCYAPASCTVYDFSFNLQDNGSRTRAAALHNASIIAGHFSYDLAPILMSGGRTFTCVTLVREPLGRIISYYYERIYPVWDRRNLSRANPALLRGKLSLFHGTKKGAHDEGAINTTWGILCGNARASRGECSLADATERLQTKCLVGVHERRQETCSLFNRALPWLQWNCTANMHAHPGLPHESVSELPAPIKGVLHQLAEPTDLPLYATALIVFERQLYESRTWAASSVNEAV